MNVPEKGFYYHYKHNPAGEVGDYAYEVMGVGHHTEKEGEYFVVYRPMYEAFVYKQGKLFDVRPLAMFMERVVKDGKEMNRFTKITDPKIIAELEKIRDIMYV